MSVLVAQQAPDFTAPAVMPEEILNDAVHRGEPLQMGGRLEAPHLALALPRWLM